jgi:hypothetical protein
MQFTEQKQYARQARTSIYKIDLTSQLKLNKGV